MCVASVSQVKHGGTWIVRVVVQQLDKLEEDGAGLALGEYVDNHGRVEPLA